VTFGQIKTIVFRRLRESSSSPVFWTEADVEQAINDAYMELSDEAEWNETSKTVALCAARPYYDVRTMLGPKALTVGRGFNRQTNRWLIPTVPRDLDPFDPRWERVTGEPQRVMVRGLFWFGYWPLAQSDGGEADQFFTELPDPLEADSDEPGFPESLHEALVEGALADLWSQDGEPELALKAWQTYLAYEGRLVAWLNDRLAAPQVRGFRAH
jgi:hypothetical protein